MSHEEDSLVNVILAVRNGRPYLAEALASVLSQSYRPIEVVVVDDGSTDDSIALAMSFGDEVRVIAREHAGIGATRNVGVMATSGPLLTFFDADDVMEPRALERQVEALHASPSADIAYGYTAEFLSEDAAGALGLRRPSARTLLRSSCAMLITRDAFLRVGMFDPAIRTAVELEWKSRADAAGLIQVVHEAVVRNRRLHAGNFGLHNTGREGEQLRVLKAGLDRRRRRASERGAP
jgi:glycosyltransferase involved in cell wall biosynthesis